MTEELRETTSISERSATTAKQTGKMLVQLISPGWGSSGYYAPEVLQEAAANRVIPAGTHMYADHPSKSAREDRPERSIRDLMAVTTSDAQLASNGALVAETRVLAPYQELITDLKDHIGVSILGDATDIYEGVAEGRKGRIIAGLAKVNSVDFVTRAGRGGQVLELLESAREGTLEERVEVLPDAWLIDGIHVELAEALEEVATSAAGVQGTEKLHAYWRHGEGAAKIRWGVAGDFQRCVDHLGKYVADPKGYCAKMHKDVTGATPGHAPGEVKASDDTPPGDLEEAVREIPRFGAIDEAGDHVYHWKHGWIPLDHADAGSASLRKGEKVMYARPERETASHTVVNPDHSLGVELDTGFSRVYVPKDKLDQIERVHPEAHAAVKKLESAQLRLVKARDALSRASGKKTGRIASDRMVQLRQKVADAQGAVVAAEQALKSKESVEEVVREIPRFGAIDEAAGKVYHWKHGWIPLDHAAAGDATATGPGAGRRTK